MHDVQDDLNKNQNKLSLKIQLTSANQTKFAKFLGWQPTPKGEIVALYNIIDQKHPRYGSTVTEDTLRELKLQVPETPLKPFSFPQLRSPIK